MIGRLPLMIALLCVFTMTQDLAHRAAATLAETGWRLSLVLTNHGSDETGPALSLRLPSNLALRLMLETEPSQVIRIRR